MITPANIGPTIIPILIDVSTNPTVVPTPKSLPIIVAAPMLAGAVNALPILKIKVRNNRSQKYLEKGIKKRVNVYMKEPNSIRPNFGNRSDAIPKGYCSKKDVIVASENIAPI